MILRIFNILVMILINVLLVSSAYAGDYFLYVSNDYYAPCAELARKMHKWEKEQIEKGVEIKVSMEELFPIKTSAEVAKSFKQYFSGQQIDIPILIAALVNGHLKFCGMEEVEEVYESLKQLKKEGVKKKQSDLEDFIYKIEQIIKIKKNKLKAKEILEDSSKKSESSID